MNRLPEGPLPDRVVIVGLISTLGLVFALIFWTVRLSPPGDGPLLWRQPGGVPALSAPTTPPRPPLPAGGSTI